MKFTYTIEVEAEEYTGDLKGMPKDFYARQKLLDVFGNAATFYRDSIIRTMARFNPELPHHKEQTDHFIKAVENEIAETDKMAKTIKPIVNINNSIDDVFISKTPKSERAAKFQQAMDEVKQAEVVKDVHTEHCCTFHGCKYGDKDCPVVLGTKPPSYPCSGDFCGM